MTITRGWIFAGLLAACAGAPPAAKAPAAAAAPVASDPHAGHDHDPAATAEHHYTDDSLVGVIDQPAPPWQVSQWFNSPAMSLEQLRGKVVFVRWFTSPDCPFCTGTAPTLRALDERYGDKGLVVVGMYHHKEQTPLDPQQVEGWIKHYGYRFPVAIDKDWTTLRKWWLDGHDRAYTSVSFLIDKTGVIRRVHLGGLIAPQGEDIAAIDSDVERLLAQ
jgi:peroxiredoxin